MDSDSAESLLDSVDYRISPNPLDSAESEFESKDSAESESKDSVVHYLKILDIRKCFDFN